MVKKTIRPFVSLDTRHVKTAKVGVELGVDIINDVSGMSNGEMLSLLKDSEAGYVLTHSLDVPVRPENVLTEDPVAHLQDWLEKKLEIFEKNNIALDRIFFDPGIGFGKTPLQSLKILKDLKSFQSCPVRLLIGHSRKSFMKDFQLEKCRVKGSGNFGNFHVAYSTKGGCFANS